ncbi:MAG: hypothetical protein U0325_15690 [Polyangiales bacterium]
MRVLRALFPVALAVYPALLLYALAVWGPRTAALLVLALSLPRAALALRDARPEDRAHALAVPGTVALFASLGALSGDARLLLAAPTLVNLALLAHFGRSLRTDTPLVERFARMQVPDLSDAERAWCRGVTVAWCVFFAGNALTAALLAALAPLRWWAAYTGGVAYALMAALFTAEYLARSVRFRRYGANPLDRALARRWPPSSTEGACAKAST